MNDATCLPAAEDNVLYDAEVDHEHVNNSRWLNSADLKLEARLLGMKPGDCMEDLRMALQRCGLDEPLNPGRRVRKGARA
jgi:hypothetical protein